MNNEWNRRSSAEKTYQDRIVERVALSTEPEVEVRAFGVGGSVSRGTSDDWSDVDLYPVMSSLPDELIAPQLAQKWTKPIGQSLLVLMRGKKPGFGLVVQVVFSNLLKIDFNFNSLSTLKKSPLWRLRSVVFDKDGSFRAFLGQQRKLWSETKLTQHAGHTVASHRDVFWVEYLKAYKSVARGELWAALFYLERLRKIVCFALRQESKRLPINFDRPYRLIEQQAPETLASLGDTLASYSKRSVVESLGTCVDLMVSLPASGGPAELESAILQARRPESLLGK